MNLNHINIPVENVKEAILFFEQYFDFRCIEVKGDNALAVMEGSNGFVLVLMSQVFNKNEINEFPTAFHIGFLLPSKEEVIIQYKKLKQSGVILENEPSNMRGVFGFYFVAPGKILIEVSSKQ